MPLPWSPADPGPALLGVLREQLLPDDPWTLSEPRGLSWWPHRLRQRLSAGPPVDANGTRACRLHADLDVLSLPEGGLSPSSRERLVATLVELARFPALAAFRLDEARGRVVLGTGVFVREPLAGSALPRFGVAAMLAATYAELGLSRLAELTGLAPVVDEHPAHGPRPHPDDLLNLAAERVRPAGERPSRWTGSTELSEAAAELTGLGDVARARPDGLDARLPQACLLQVRVDEEHPELGSGVFLRLFLPTRQRPVPTSGPGELALELNALESREATGPAPAARFSSLGAWTLERSEPEIELPVRPGPPRLSHVTFLPSYLYVENALRNLVVEERERALWASHVLGHDEKDA